jgi:Holliday junction resolvase RusA-like endonuclease
MEAIVIEVAGDAAPFAKKVASWTAKDGRFGTHAYDTKRYSSWKDQARYTAAQVMGGRPPLDCGIEFTVRVYRQIPATFSRVKHERALADLLRPLTTPDYDNLAKAAADAMIGIVFRDDKLIHTAHIYKRYSDRPRVVIEVVPDAPIEQRRPTLTQELFGRNP